MCGSEWERVTVRVAVSGSGCVAVCGSVRGRVWECARQCVAVRTVVCAHTVRAIVIYMSGLLLLRNNNSDIVARHMCTRMLRNNDLENYYCSSIPCCVYVAQLTIIQIIIAARVCVYIYIYKYMLRNKQ